MKHVDMRCVEDGVDNISDCLTVMMTANSIMTELIDRYAMEDGPDCSVNYFIIDGLCKTVCMAVERANKSVDRMQKEIG